MTRAERYRLISGPYKAPALHVGDRAVCLYRDCEVVVTSWTDAPIPWPRCRAIHSRGGAGLLVNKELLRAIRTESAEAIKHWFGVSTKAVWSWRKAFGIGHWGTKGSRRLHLKSCEAGARKVRGQPRPRKAVEQMVATRKARGDYGVPNRWKDTGWKPEQLALLGTMPDEAVATRFGRTPNAVRIRRTRLGIPPAPGC